MLVFYKPFKFSDIVFERWGRMVGQYKKNPLDMTVYRLSTVPDLYDVSLHDFHLYNNTLYMYKKTEAEIEVYVNETIKASRRVNTI